MTEERPRMLDLFCREGGAYRAGWRHGQHRLCPRCGVELEREVAEERAERGSVMSIPDRTLPPARPEVPALGHGRACASFAGIARGAQECRICSGCLMDELYHTSRNPL